MRATTPTLDRRSHFAEALKADSRKILDACGVPATPNFINRVVVKYLERVAHTGFPFGPWLVSQIQLTSEQRRRGMQHPDVAYCLSYSDPTGEQAVSRVMRAG